MDYIEHRIEELFNLLENPIGVDAINVIHHKSLVKYLVDFEGSQEKFEAYKLRLYKIEDDLRLL